MDVFEHIAIHKPTLSITELLLLDIARSLHAQNILAERNQAAIDKMMPQDNDGTPQ